MPMAAWAEAVGEDEVVTGVGAGVKKAEAMVEGESEASAVELN